MDEYVFKVLNNYFNVLGNLGYCDNGTVNNLLVLLFIYKITQNDVNGYLSKEDYIYIDKALNCMYGTSCLIPYPEYSKMKKFGTATISELANRVKSLEDTEVLKVYSDEESASIIDDSDVLLIEESDKET